MTQRAATKLARWIFAVAAVYGIPVLGSMFFVVPRIMPHAWRDQPELYYGFACVGLAWQVVFILIATDPARFRPLMLVAALLEKFPFVVFLTELMIRHIAGLHWIGPAAADFVLGCAFLAAYVTTYPQKPNEPG
jgi:hypothetical protein